VKKLQSMAVVVSCLALALLICGANAAFAQEVTGTIAGTVTDESGAAVARRQCHCQIRRTRKHLSGHVQRNRSLPNFAAPPG
jgi:hypothetical protein